jgi:DNA-binding transcriptional LysR family regulator
MQAARQRAADRSSLTTADGAEPASPGPAPPPRSGAVPQGLELRHLRYFVAVADAGTFTQAAGRTCIAQPTLSQQIRRLEELVGAPLLQRRREGVRLTEAGAVLLEESRAVLSLVDRGMSRAREAAGLGRPRLRFVVPPFLPEALAVEAASRLRATAASAGAEVVWMETALDAEFSLICQRRADAGLGWLTPARAGLPDQLDLMSLGDFEPDVWIPATYPAVAGGAIGLDALAHLDVVHGPRRVSPGTYDAWLAVLRATSPRFAFTDPPFRNSLPMTLAFAATGSRPTAVLTGPCHRPGTGRRPAPPARAPGGTCDMAPARISGHPLTATAALVWHGDLSRPLQQALFDAAESITS